MFNKTPNNPPRVLLKLNNSTVVVRIQTIQQFINPEVLAHKNTTNGNFTTHSYQLNAHLVLISSFSSAHSVNVRFRILRRKSLLYSKGLRSGKQ